VQKKRKMGTGIAIPFLNNPVDLEKLDEHLYELIKSELKREPDFERINWGWGCLGLLINPKHLKDDSEKFDEIKGLLQHWNSKISTGFNPNEYKVGNEMPAVNKKGLLQMDWVGELDELDFVIATATKPEIKKYPDATEIAHRMNLNDFHKYFFKNKENGITTFQDTDIDKALKTAGMDIINLIARSSVHIIMTKPASLEPEGFGSGCIVKYRDRFFLVSVAHVTDIKGLETCIETNLPSKDLQTPLYCVGSMMYFDEYKVSEDIKRQEIKTFEDLNASYDDTLDVTFCEVKEHINQLQPEWDFGKFVIYKGPKAYLNLEEAGPPEKDKSFGFCGRIKQNFSGALLKTQPTMKLDLKYHGTRGRYHYFLATEIIKDADDYRGSSGAPILDEDGKLVALVTTIVVNSRLIFGFSIDECKRLIDTFILNDQKTTI
jgi:hypothetical protein